MPVKVKFHGCFNEAEAIKPRIPALPPISDDLATRFNEAEAIKPRIRQQGFELGHGAGGFNEAEAIKPRILGILRYVPDGLRRLQ